ncbi:MAG: hypothetical protein M1830_009317 [Pleopsidium flavum]|nr:MAG: hypothetical protein M1830_009317 [Pleopsidium flavum]
MSTLAYRDLDFVFQNEAPSLIEFPNLSSPCYVSTMPKLLSKPDENTPSPQFQNVMRHFRQAQFSFSCDHDTARFLEALSGWKLKFFRRVPKVVVEEKALFLSSKKSYEKADVQLWDKTSDDGPPKVQLAVRCDGEANRRWLTTSLSESALAVNSSLGNDIVLRNLEIQQGNDVENPGMTASCRSPEEEINPEKRWTVTISFKDPEDKDSFIKQAAPFGAYSPSNTFPLESEESRLDA